MATCLTTLPQDLFDDVVFRWILSLLYGAQVVVGVPGYFVARHHGQDDLLGFMILGYAVVSLPIVGAGFYSCLLS